MSVSRYETVLTIANQAAVECGLAVTSALFSSTDANFILLRTLANSCGRELCMMRPWRHLLKNASLTAAAAVAPETFGRNTLPTDFDYAINDTFWNATTGEPLNGPVDEQVWEYHINSGTVPTPSIFKLEGNELWLYDDVDTDTITCKYLSLYWVKATGETAPNKTACTVDTDTIHHHPLLIARLLKLRFMQARGMDTTAALVDFETTYEMVASHERPAPTLGLGGPRGVKFIDWSNVPDTGFGS